MALEPDLTIRETAALSGASKGMIEKAVESKVLTVALRDGVPRRTGRRFLPVRAVAYFAALRRAQLTDLPVEHKKAIWSKMSERSGDDLEAIEFLPGVTLDLARLASDPLRRAVEYMKARDAHVVSDPAILGGTPVLRGTRITVYSVHGRMANGETLDDLVEDYPDIPRSAFAAADIYAATHPLRGRPSGRPWHAASNA